MCGAPLVRISYWLVWLFLTVTVACYGIYGLYAKDLVWPIPLYLYHVFVFVALTLIITRRQTWMSFRVILWSLLLVYAMTFLVLTTSRFFHNLSTDMIEVLQNVRETYFGIGAVSFAVLVSLVLGGVALTHRFKFTLAYRIFLTFLAAVCFIGSRLLDEPEIGDPKKLSNIALWLPDTTIAEFLGILAVNFIRILAAEMVVYSSVMSFAPANARFRELSQRVMRQQHYGSQPHSVVMQASSQVTLALLRAGVYVQYLFITLWHTLQNYAWGMYRTLRRLTIDFITPVGTLAGIAFLLGMIAEHTAAYLNPTDHTTLLYLPGIHIPLVMIGLAVVGVFVLHLLFLAAVTKYRWPDLWRCNVLLALWLGPFVFAVFLFISLMLIATGTVLRHWGHESFPYHVGPLTLVSAAGLLLMVAFALFYRGKQHPGEPRGLGANIRRRLLLTGPAAHSEDQHPNA
jgi:hypothetical protein